MDTIDKSDSNAPARFPADSARAPAPIPTISHDLAIAPAFQPHISSRVLLRGLSRHWWRILLLSLVVYAPLAYTIWRFVEPTYEAFSLLEIEPTTELLNPRREIPDLTSALPYLHTQVELITGDPVLDAAVSDLSVVNLPMIMKSEDPKADLREKMRVEIVGKNTYLIKVALESRNAEEAAAIVRAVVEAYTKQHDEYHRSSNKALKETLKTELGKLKVEIEDRQNELKALVETGDVEVAKPQPSPRKAEQDGDSTLETPAVTAEEYAKVRNSAVTTEEYARVRNSLFDTDMELLEAQTDLDAAQRAKEKAHLVEVERQSRPTDAELEARIEVEFKKDPEVAPLIDVISDTKKELDAIKSVARKSSDPAMVRLDRKYKELKGEYDELWYTKYNELSQKLAAEGPDLEPKVRDAKITELQARVEKLKTKQGTLVARLDRLKIETKNKNNETLSAKLVEMDLTGLVKMQETIRLKLKNLEFVTDQENFRVSVRNPAAVPRTPSNNKRLKYMAAAPVGILFLALGLFLMLEIKAERVGDPEALSTRMQSEVYALPPLPTARSMRKRSLPGADDQIEQFIQRLDHLRFAVCGNPTELEKGRCVLITSAIGGEGKTTLAAQLAARCGNAGMSTLLIDADLRRTGLCSLLDVPEGPGLSDALDHNELPATELVIPIQGGTFHLLPAGTPLEDTSRVFQNRKLGLLIAQFRQLYDLVIIDSPPVLPVPDALIIGRWVNGAVLAVRYDISRFPQVERARRQLDGAGIAVLGTVINGMRHSDTYYGRYSHKRRRSAQPDSSGAF